jgi:hypothetical protein
MLISVIPGILLDIVISKTVYKSVEIGDIYCKIADDATKTICDNVGILSGPKHNLVVEINVS